MLQVECEALLCPPVPTKCFSEQAQLSLRQQGSMHAMSRQRCLNTVVAAQLVIYVVASGVLLTADVQLMRMHA